MEKRLLSYWTTIGSADKNGVTRHISCVGVKSPGIEEVDSAISGIRGTCVFLQRPFTLEQRTSFIEKESEKITFRADGITRSVSFLCHAKADLRDLFEETRTLFSEKDRENTSSFSLSI